MPDKSANPHHICGDPNSPCDMECVEKTQWSQFVKEQKKKKQPPKLEWECINDNPDGSSDHRARVFGGWLVKSVYNVCSPSFHQMNGDGFGHEWRASIAFVPDPNHEWTGESENS